MPDYPHRKFAATATELVVGELITDAAADREGHGVLLQRLKAVEWRDELD